MLIMKIEFQNKYRGQHFRFHHNQAIVKQKKNKCEYQKPNSTCSWRKKNILLFVLRTNKFVFRVNCDPIEAIILIRTLKKKTPAKKKQNKTSCMICPRHNKLRTKIHHLPETPVVSQQFGR